ncbi:MAG: hypothetical protein DMF51_13020 [Acidobacteria bacterium]|nr:MAG: hypothetical protein DMF51_13020 [Acidobacteriota bacterium]
MSPSWTRRRPHTPPDSGLPFARLAVALVALLLVAASAPACGRSKNENRIKPIFANLNIDTFTGSPNPAVFLRKEKTTGDMVTVSVNLHTTSTIDFDAFTLEFDYDPNLVQVSDTFDVNSILLGDCCFPGSNTCTPIQPQCIVNSDANSRGVFLLGVAAVPGGQTASVSADTTLVTLDFVAATVIDPPGTPIKLISGQGSCEILNALFDQGVPCFDLNATMTTSR